MDGQEVVVGRVESDNESRFDQEPPEEAQPADEQEDDADADVTMSTAEDVSEEPSLSVSDHLKPATRYHLGIQNRPF